MTSKIVGTLEDLQISLRACEDVKKRVAIRSDIRRLRQEAFLRGDGTRQSRRCTNSCDNAPMRKVDLEVESNHQDEVNEHLTRASISGGRPNPINGALPNVGTAQNARHHSTHDPGCTTARTFAKSNCGVIKDSDCDVLSGSRSRGTPVEAGSSAAGRFDKEEIKRSVHKESAQVDRSCRQTSALAPSPSQASGGRASARSRSRSPFSRFRGVKLSAGPSREDPSNSAEDKEPNLGKRRFSRRFRRKVGKPISIHERPAGNRGLSPADSASPSSPSSSCSSSALSPRSNFSDDASGEVLFPKTPSSENNFVRKNSARVVLRAIGKKLFAPKAKLEPLNKKSNLPEPLQEIKADISGNCDVSNSALRPKITSTSQSPAQASPVIFESKKIKPGQMEVLSPSRDSTPPGKRGCSRHNVSCDVANKIDYESKTIGELKHLLNEITDFKEKTKIREIIRNLLLDPEEDQRGLNKELKDEDSEITNNFSATSLKRNRPLVGHQSPVIGQRSPASFNVTFNNNNLKKDWTPPWSAEKANKSSFRSVSSVKFSPNSDTEGLKSPPTVEASPVSARKDCCPIVSVSFNAVKLKSESTIPGSKPNKRETSTSNRDYRPSYKTPDHVISRTESLKLPRDFINSRRSASKSSPEKEVGPPVPASTSSSSLQRSVSCKETPTNPEDLPFIPIVRGNKRRSRGILGRILGTKLDSERVPSPSHPQYQHPQEEEQSLIKSPELLSSVPEEATKQLQVSSKSFQLEGNPHISPPAAQVVVTFDKAALSVDKLPHLCEEAPPVAETTTAEATSPQEDGVRSFSESTTDKATLFEVVRSLLDKVIRDVEQPPLAGLLEEIEEPKSVQESSSNSLSVETSESLGELPEQEDTSCEDSTSSSSSVLQESLAASQELVEEEFEVERVNTEVIESEEENSEKFFSSVTSEHHQTLNQGSTLVLLQENLTLYQEQILTLPEVPAIEQALVVKEDVIFGEESLVSGSCSSTEADTDEEMAGRYSSRTRFGENSGSVKSRILATEDKRQTTPDVSKYKKVREATDARAFRSSDSVKSRMNRFSNANGASPSLNGSARTPRITEVTSSKAKSNGILPLERSKDKSGKESLQKVEDSEVVEVNNNTTKSSKITISGNYSADLASKEDKKALDRLEKASKIVIEDMKLLSNEREQIENLPDIVAIELTQVEPAVDKKATDKSLAHLVDNTCEDGVSDDGAKDVSSPTVSIDSSFTESVNDEKQSRDENASEREEVNDRETLEDVAAEVDTVQSNGVISDASKNSEIAAECVDSSPQPPSSPVNKEHSDVIEEKVSERRVRSRRRGTDEASSKTKEDLVDDKLNRDKLRLSKLEPAQDALCVETHVTGRRRRRNRKSTEGSSKSESSSASSTAVSTPVSPGPDHAKLIPEIDNAQPRDRDLFAEDKEVPTPPIIPEVKVTEESENATSEDQSDVDPTTPSVEVTSRGTSPERDVKSSEACDENKEGSAIKSEGAVSPPEHTSDIEQTTEASEQSPESEVTSDGKIIEAAEKVEEHLPTKTADDQADMRYSLDNLSEIKDEEILQKLLYEAEGYEERRMVRTAIRALRKQGSDKPKETTTGRWQATRTTISTKTAGTRDRYSGNVASKTLITTKVETTEIKRVSSPLGGASKKEALDTKSLADKYSLKSDSTKKDMKSSKKIGSIFDREEKAPKKTGSRLDLERRQAERKREITRNRSMPTSSSKDARKMFVAKLENQSESKSAGKKVGRSPTFVVPNAHNVKQMLLKWCQAKTRGYEHVDIQNFSGSWASGMAFCALVHNFFPESFDYSILDPKSRASNFDLAFKMAEKHGEIPSLLDTDDMIRMVEPDWKCVYTYITEFYKRIRELGMM
ncbi:uncharacterized protein LOC143463439 isoform X2 [Clavelina lepadiformis]|uniref:uncharacterized protein LOC143463439 isoform X2 n=1 Tax=Clavelina lepadiformis TaxID=159417 RepID=UPI004041499E